MVHSPYTPFFGDAFMAAHGAIGVLLIALLWWTFPKANLARTLLFIAIVLATVSPLLGDFIRGFGSKAPPLTLEQDTMLVASSMLFGSMIAARRFAIAFASLLMAVLNLKLQEWLLDSWSELAALQLVWIGVVLGLVRRRAPVDDAAPTSRSARSYGIDDGIIFAIASVTAAIVSTYVLQRADGSADEWAYTWQAATFARGHLYATPPPCETAFQSFYVFESVGRQFAQYTPGWPYFMTPFALFGVPWLAGPFSHGLMAIGIARVARRAVRLDGRGTRTRERSAGWIAALVATFGTTILLCGASRYSHVFVAALLAWALEALLFIATEDASSDRKMRWGLVLGSCIALMGATRPSDGATLSVGMAFYFLYALLRGRIGARAFGGTLLGFLFWGGLTLIILRVQLGSWFKTGYSLNEIIHPWNITKYGWPKPGDWKYALPLATGSYAWFPCSLALGVAGIASLRGRATGLIVMLALGFLSFETYYQYINLARGYDWGYGPRYELPFVVLMGVGTGVALAPLFENARKHIASRRALYAGGPAAIASCAIVVTLVRLWPLLYPGIYMHVHQHDSVNQRIREMGLHDAVVLVEHGATGFDPLDLTENLPIDLYPSQDALIAIERKPEFAQCIRNNFPRRQLWRASGNPVVITPY